MRCSDAGRALLEAQESFLTYVYDDHDGSPVTPPVGSHAVGRAPESVIGYATIGYGHKLRAGEAFPAGITQEQGDLLFERDLMPCEAAINAHVSAPISQHAFDALCSFAFNCGIAGFCASTLLELLNAGAAPDVVAAQFGRWIHGKGGVVLDALVKRREAERAMFLTPDDQTS